MSIDASSSLPQTGPEQDKGSGSIVVDGISYIPSSVLLTGIPKISFKDNRAFGVVDSYGEAPRLYSQSSELGFYYNDTRYLGIWETTFNGQRPVPLTHELRNRGNSLVFSMTNRDLNRVGASGRIPRDTFLIRKILTFHHDRLFEVVEIKNFDVEPHKIQVEQWAGGRFDDVFEVRGFPRPRRGKMLPPVEQELNGYLATVLQYEGLDQRVRKTYVQRLFQAEKIRLSPLLVGYFTLVEVAPKETVCIKTVVAFDEPSDCRIGGVFFRDLPVGEQMRILGREASGFSFSGLTFESDNAIINRAVHNAQTDIFMLMTEEPSHHIYPYAGVPWFSAPFGRDGLITAYQLMPWYPEFSRGVLDYAFQMIGKREDPFTDEQPGKIFHEMRRGEMANTREVPFIPYFGSVDSTPLCLVLLHEYIKWTMDLESLKKWWGEALRALAWIEQWGDSDGDGFLEYARKSPTGLLNQGWKDSNDSVMHADGRLAQTPIRLCEVQAYAFRARMGMSALARLMGQSDLAARLRLEALQLRARFNEQFWDSERGFVYLALDGESKPCKVISSNMGHCLWANLLDPQQARLVSDHLMSEAMFSGHGIRTLADTEVMYNPMSYHNGSIWPHDNSLIMDGFRNYGHLQHLDKLMLAMIGILESSQDFRLPELFCGFRKRGVEPPVPYEVACKPQAWAAGSIFLMLRAMLGISMDVDQKHLVFNSPILTSKASYLRVAGLRGRDWEIDVTVQGGASGRSVDVRRRRGNVRVLVVK